MAIQIDSATDEGRKEFQDHVGRVAKALLNGRVVPFLGAGVNLCVENAVWPPAIVAPPASSATGNLGGSGNCVEPTPSRPSRLPSGGELANYLAKRFGYSAQGCAVAGCTTLDLARVSQYGATMEDEGPLYDHLLDAFEGRFAPTVVHRFLAQLPRAGARAPEDAHPLIVTTNYDDLMEQAMEGKCDLVYYDPTMPADPSFPELVRPGFWHREAGGECKPVQTASNYPYAFFRERPSILKIHGTLDPTSARRSGVVITEDDYIEYLVKAPLETLLPRRLLEKMRANHHLLFLGYSLRDWNFRVFLRGLKRTPQESYRGWAVLNKTDIADAKFWEKNNVDIVVGDLAEYIAKLQDAL